MENKWHRNSGTGCVTVCGLLGMIDAGRWLFVILLIVLPFIELLLMSLFDFLATITSGSESDSLKVNDVAAVDDAEVEDIEFDTTVELDMKGSIVDVGGSADAIICSCCCCCC